MSFSSIGHLADSMTAGKILTCSFRKVPSQASTAGWWVDLSMASGNPPPNFYAAEPAVAAQLDGLRGIFHGDNQSPAQKHLKRLGLCSPTAALIGQYMLIDYLLYYPFVDMDDTAEQAMDNTLALPRYSLEGAQVMVVAVAPTVGGGQFTMTYVNQDGNTAVSPTQFCGTAAANISNIITGQPATVAGVGPFLQLAAGDTGVRSITSVTFTVPNGGLAAFVLVKPIADSVIREINAAREVEFVNQRAGLPRIIDGAYLGLIMNCAASVAAGQLMGYADFIWD